MGSFFFVFVVAALAAALFMPVVLGLAHRIGALDNSRDPPVPRIGGLAVALGCAAALGLVGAVFSPARLALVTALPSIGRVALGASVILVLGLVDDVRPLPAAVKFAVQIGVASAMYALGMQVQFLSLPLGTIDLGAVLAPLATILWLVGICNAFNLLDGADGVAAGSAFFAATAIFLMSVALGHPAMGLVTAGLAGALLGFLPFNFPPARAFLGDSGSMVTGFLLAGLAAEGSTKGPTLVAITVPLVAFGVPVFDTTITLIRRMVRGHAIFKRDHEHIHHRLLRAGLGPRHVVGVLYVASAAFALAAMMFINPGIRPFGVGLVAFGAGVWVVARSLHLDEVNELARAARHAAAQPWGLALDVQLRNATEQLAGAPSLDGLKEAVAVLLSRSRFDDVLLVVSPKGERRGHAHAWRLENGRFVADSSHRGAGEWEMVCPFEGAGWRGELRLRWRLGGGSPLPDLYLLLELVQPALAKAAQRIEATAALSE
jgi:UDP-GlcNAc:undecaprenyl-phosphate GlcNAc-1-phosphate transferase